MSFTVIDDRVESPIKPDHINASQHFYDAFGNRETEISARYIVRYCQKSGEWLPFTAEDIESFYHRVSGYTGFSFNRLIDDGWIVKRDNKYYVTLQFVDRVHAASPVI